MKAPASQSVISAHSCWTTSTGASADHTACGGKPCSAAPESDCSSAFASSTLPEDSMRAVLAETTSQVQLDATSRRVLSEVLLGVSAVAAAGVVGEEVGLHAGDTPPMPPLRTIPWSNTLRSVASGASMYAAALLLRGFRAPSYRAETNGGRDPGALPCMMASMRGLARACFSSRCCTVPNACMARNKRGRQDAPAPCAREMRLCSTGASSRTSSAEAGGCSAGVRSVGE